MKTRSVSAKQLTTALEEAERERSPGTGQNGRDSDSTSSRSTSRSSSTSETSSSSSDSEPRPKRAHKANRKRERKGKKKGVSIKTKLPPTRSARGLHGQFEFNRKLLKRLKKGEFREVAKDLVRRKELLSLCDKDTSMYDILDAQAKYDDLVARGFDKDVITTALRSASERGQRQSAASARKGYQWRRSDQGTLVQQLQQLQQGMLQQQALAMHQVPQPGPSNWPGPQCWICRGYGHKAGTCPARPPGGGGASGPAAK